MYLPRITAQDWCLYSVDISGPHLITEVLAHGLMLRLCDRKCVSLRDGTNSRQADVRSGDKHGSTNTKRANAMDSQTRSKGQSSAIIGHPFHDTAQFPTGISYYS
jgi:hypothetical protein